MAKSTKRKEDKEQADRFLLIQFCFIHLLILLPLVVLLAKPAM
jgi:hypothetical protein